jgi:ABC-type multidrug transport system fused ATPase/permease subunit
MYAAILSEAVGGGISESVGGVLKAQGGFRVYWFFHLCSYYCFLHYLFKGSGARLFSLLDKDPSSNFISHAGSLEDSQTQPIKLSPKYEPTIQFEDVKFAFPSHPNTQILNEVSFRLTNGEFLALTGSSGSGKTSIIALLLRFYEPSGGSISLDGFDIKDLVRYFLSLI